MLPTMNTTETSPERMNNETIRTTLDAAAACSGLAMASIVIRSDDSVEVGTPTTDPEVIRKFEAYANRLFRASLTIHRIY